MRSYELPLCAVWYGACASAYLLGMLDHLRRLKKAPTGGTLAMTPAPREHQHDEHLIAG
jgi:hypothetical protein